VELTETVVVAGEVEALGVVSLHGRVVAVEVLQLELGQHDSLGGLLVLGDGVDDGLGDVDHDATLEQEAFEGSGGLKLGLEAFCGLDSLLENGTGNLSFKLVSSLLGLTRLAIRRKQLAKWRFVRHLSPAYVSVQFEIV